MPTTASCWKRLRRTFRAPPLNRRRQRPPAPGPMCRRSPTPKLAATQAEVRSRLEAEAAANAMLRDGLEETRRQLDESRASMATVETARAAIDAKYQEMVAHNKKLTDAVAEMQREVDHARQDAASNVAKVEAAKGELQKLKVEQASQQKQVQALEVARKAAEAQYQEALADHQRLTETIAAMQRDVDGAKAGSVRAGDQFRQFTEAASGAGGRAGCDPAAARRSQQEA